MMSSEETGFPLSDACCCCGHEMTAQELIEYRSMSDEQLHAEPYCRACRQTALLLCRECSSRYTAAGVCDRCTVPGYGQVG